MQTPSRLPSNIFPALVFLAVITCLGPIGADDSAKQVNWLTGENVNLGGVLFPHAHFNSAYGGSTTDPASLLVGHHDPDREGWNITNIEFAASLRAGEYFEAFGAYAAKIDLDDNWAGQYEEWFGKLKNLPGGLELRGGRYYNRFGIQNTFHPHGFDWVDQYLVNGRFLGEDGLTSIGGEVTWTLPVNWTSLINVSVGVAPKLEEEEHAEPAIEPEFEAEGATFEDVITVVNWTNLYDYNDFHQFRGGLSGAWGRNEAARTTQIYGVHLEYQWRQNGYESGGRYFRWRNEAMFRSFGAVSEPSPATGKTHGADLNEFGMYSALAYGLDNGLEFGLRGDYVSGTPSAGLDERFRLSPSFTYYLNKNRTMYFRAQYNYDHGSDFGSASSVWTQIGINWGGAEVR